MRFAPKLTPELDVDDLDRSLTFYQGVLGFRVLYSWPEDRCAYLDRDGVHLMLEERGGSGRTFGTAPMAHPYGRGVNFQIEVADVAGLSDRVLISGVTIPIPMEERWYRQGGLEVGRRQFVVADPDGYLLRFFSPLGTRPARFRTLAELRAAFADLSTDALQDLVDDAVATIRKPSS